MSSGRQTSEARREALIAAAMPAFARFGLHGTAVSAVTDAVGITQPYAFSLFGTKKGLFLAAVDYCFDQVTERFRQAAERVPAEERLEAMGHAYVEYLENRDVLLFQMQCYAACGEPEVKALVRKRFEGLFAFVQEVAQVGPDDARDFLAMGMICNVAATLDFDDLVPRDGDEPGCEPTREGTASRGKKAAGGKKVKGRVPTSRKGTRA